MGKCYEMALVYFLFKTCCKWGFCMVRKLSSRISPPGLLSASRSCNQKPSFTPSATLYIRASLFAMSGLSKSQDKQVLQ